MTTSLEVAFASASLSLSEAAGETERRGLQLKLCLKNHVFKATDTSDAHDPAAHQSAVAPPSLTRFSPRRRAADSQQLARTPLFFFQPLSLSDSNSDRPVRNLTFTVARPSHTRTHQRLPVALPFITCAKSAMQKDNPDRRLEVWGGSWVGGGDGWGVSRALDKVAVTLQR